MVVLRTTALCTVLGKVTKMNGRRPRAAPWIVPAGFGFLAAILGTVLFGALAVLVVSRVYRVYEITHARPVVTVATYAVPSGGGAWPSYTKGLSPTAADLKQGYAAIFATTAQAQAHLAYALRVPRALPPSARLIHVRIDADRATTRLVYALPRGTMQVVETPYGYTHRPPGAVAVAIGTVTGYIEPTTRETRIEWSQQEGGPFVAVNNIISMTTAGQSRIALAVARSM